MSASDQYVVATKDAPGAIGPYSQAVRCGDFLYMSGQIALDPAAGKLVGDTVEAQTQQVLKNIAAVLKSEGLSARHLAKTTIFLKNLADFQVVNTIYGEFVQDPYPARATVEVSRLPLNALVEIEAIACYSRA